MHTFSRLLNQMLFGSRVADEPDVVSAWGSIGLSYALNLFIVFVVVATFFASLGIYHPFENPLAASELRLPLLIANLLTFLLTFVASLEWQLSSDAVERQRAAKRTGIEYSFLLCALWMASLLFLAAVYVAPGFGVVLAGAFVQSALIQLMLSKRALKS